MIGQSINQSITLYTTTSRSSRKNSSSTGISSSSSSDLYLIPTQYQISHFEEICLAFHYNPFPQRIANAQIMAAPRTTWYLPDVRWTLAAAVNDSPNSSEL